MQTHKHSANTRQKYDSAVGRIQKCFEPSIGDELALEDELPDFNGDDDDDDDEAIRDLALLRKALRGQPNEKSVEALCLY